MSTTPHNTKLPESEWFVPFRADSVSSNGRKLKITADADQLKDIAKRLNVKQVKSLSADIAMDIQNGGHILHIAGQFNADVIQECVSTLEPLESQIEENFEAWYADFDKAVPFVRAKHQIKAMEEGDEVQMLEENDDPEPLTDGQVDLGEVVVQFLSLAINPYPRKDGVGDEGDEPKEVAQIGSSLRPNPFAALKNWRPKD
jgi:uncharacterized metal-binding protein YceD (DUF177 family)